MALSGRDILFVIRAQDLASRELNRVGGSFSRLQKQMQAANQKLAAATEANSAAMKRSQEQARTATTGLTRGIQQQRQAIQENARVHKAATSAITEQIKQQQQAMVASRQQTSGASKRFNNALADERRALANNTAAIRDMAAADIESRQRMMAEGRKLNAIARRDMHTLTEAGRARAKQQILNRNAAMSAMQEEVTEARHAANELIRNERAQSAARQEGLVNQRRAMEGMAAANQQRIQGNIDALNRQKALLDSNAVADRARIERNIAQMERAKQVVADTEAARRDQIKRSQAAAQQAFQQEQARIQRVQQIAQHMQSAGMSMMMVGAMMTAIGGAGVRSFAGMVTAAADFRQEMSLALTQTDGFHTTVEELTAMAHDVAVAIPAPIEGIGEALYDIFSSTNANVEQARVLLEGFAREAVAGNSTIEAAGKSTIAIMNGMAMGVEDLTRIQDFQFQTVRKGVITYDQLAANIGKLIPSLRRAGQEIETGGAMLSFLTRNGLSAEMATTAAARSLELMTDPRVVARMEDMNMTVRDARGEFLPFADILAQLAARIGNLPAPERAREMLELFGGAGYRIQARRFLDVVLPGFEEFQKHIEWQIGAKGAMEAAYEIMFNSPQNQIQLLKNNFQVLRQEIGESFFPVLATLVSTLQDAVTWFRGLDAEVRNNIIRAIAIAAALMTIAGPLIMIGGLFTMVAGSLMTLTGSFVSAIALTIGFPIAIMAIVAALGAWIIKGDEIRAWFSSFIDWATSFEGAIDIITGALALGIAMMIAFAATGTTVSGAIAIVVSGITTVKGALMGLATAHPVLLAITVAVGAAALAFRHFTKESRQIKQEAGEFKDAFRGMFSGDDTIENLDNFRSIMAEAGREINATKFAQEGLNDAARIAGVNAASLVASIGSETIARNANLNAMKAEKARLEELWEAGRPGRWDERLPQWQADQERIAALAELIEFTERRTAVMDEAVRSEINYMKALGGVSGALATYLEFQMNFPGMDQDPMYQQLRANALMALQLANSTGSLTDAQRQWAVQMGFTEDELAGLGNQIKEVSEYSELLSQTWAALVSPTEAWNRALEKSQEALKAVDGDTDNATVSLAAWKAELQAGEASLRTGFLTTIEFMRKGANDMTGSVTDVATSLMGMGEDGMKAMALLNSASPEEFLEMMRLLRLEIALTQDHVKVHFEGMMSAIDAIMATHKDMPSERLAQMLEAATLVLSRYGQEFKGDMGAIMMGVADAMETYGALSEEAMMGLMSALVIHAVNGGEATVASLAAALGRSPAEIMALANEHEAAFGEISAAMVAGAQSAGDNAVAAISTALSAGVGIMGSWGRQYGLSLWNNFSAVPVPSLRGAGSDVRFGNIQRRNAGGWIAGIGNRDTVPALLTPGEFVINKQAAAAMSPEFLEFLNSGGLQKFAAGGPVGNYNNVNYTGNTGTTPNYTAGIPSMAGWMDRWADKYREVIAGATDTNVAAVQAIQGAVSAARTHLEAQWGLDNARRQVNTLRDDLQRLDGDFEHLSLALKDAWERAREVTAAEQLNLMDMRSGIRDLERSIASMQRGTHKLTNELSVLNQEARVEELRKVLEDLRNPQIDVTAITEAQRNLADEQVNLQRAYADLVGAQFEVARVRQIVPHIRDEVQALLMQYEAENALANAMETHQKAGTAVNDAQEALNSVSKDAVATARELRIAEIELKLAEEELNNLRVMRQFEDEELLRLQLQLLVAQQDLTQAERDSIGATEEVREAQEALKTWREERKTVEEALKQAVIDVSLAEMDAISATLGLITAGQELVGLGPAHWNYFEELARVAGVSERSIRGLIQANQDLQQSTGASAIGNMFAERGVSTDAARNERIAREVASGTRTIENVDASITRLAELQRLEGEARKLFEKHGVPIATKTETAAQRLARIALDVYRGNRSMGDVENSIKWIKENAMAKGGIVTRPTMRLLGEAGPEAVVPLGKSGMLGSTITITVEDGAFQFNGPIDSATLPDVERMLNEFMDELASELRSN